MPRLCESLGILAPHWVPGKKLQLVSEVSQKLNLFAAKNNHKIMFPNKAFGIII